MRYTETFFSSISAGSAASSEAVLPVVFDLCGLPKSMLDVGCGSGAWLATAQRLGVTEVQGVDGFVPDEQLAIDMDQFRHSDLTEPLHLNRRFDLVMTLEVAEHLPESASATFVETLTSHGDLVLFSAAVPGQRGNDHVNEQWPSYWIDLFRTRGFEVYDLVRGRVWNDERVEYYYRQNILLFAHGPAAERLRDVAAAPPLNVVHPGTLEVYTKSGVSFGLQYLRESIRRTASRRLLR
jgi:SAM-dependent methyltransferase